MRQIRNAILFLMLFIAGCTQQHAASDVPQPCPEWAGEGSCTIRLERTLIENGDTHQVKLKDGESGRILFINGDLVAKEWNNVALETEQGKVVDLSLDIIIPGVYMIQSTGDEPWLTFKNVSAGSTPVQIEFAVHVSID